jgi:anthranilate/para-aminobenzoate synthase component II
MHGKTSLVVHEGRGLFEGLPRPLPAARYHSLVVDRPSLPAELEVTAWAPEGEIMALAHRALPIHGVQFHPESFLTPDGEKLLARFLSA